ncbi:MAG: fdx [Caulobacter sp.]|nr:fdx [Caulobacter sp.]
MTDVLLHITDASGTEHEIKAAVGQNIMEVAVANRVDGIDAECGGACSCATCHVYVAEHWADAVGEPNALEAEMLDFARAERRPTSRLSCQIRITSELDGLKLAVAAD